MRSVGAVLDDLDSLVEELSALDVDALAPRQRLAVLERLEGARRRQVAISHDVINALEQISGCPPVPVTLADVLRISRTQARRRLRDAQQ